MNRDEWDKYLRDHMMKMNLMFYSYVVLIVGMVGLYTGRLLNWW